MERKDGRVREWVVRVWQRVEKGVAVRVGLEVKRESTVVRKGSSWCARSQIICTDFGTSLMSIFVIFCFKWVVMPFAVFSESLLLAMRISVSS